MDNRMNQEITHQMESAKNITALVEELQHQLIEGTPQTTFIKTGFDNLDKLIGGISLGEFMVIGGRPAMGKTQLLINLSLNISLTIPVLYITFDLSEYLLTSRFISSVSGIPTFTMLEHHFDPQQKEVLFAINKEFSKRQLYIHDFGNHSIEAVVAQCLKQIDELGIKVIMIDYLQFMNSGTSRHYRERELEVSNICRELKNMAKEHHVCVIVSCQLNRSVECRGGYKRPYLSDLRESGSIEQIADKVLFIHRPEYYGICQDVNGDSLIGVAEIIVAKNRIGRLGECPLYFRSDYPNLQNDTNDILTKSFYFSPSRLQELEDLPI